MPKTRHWTAESNEAFLHKISFDFIAQLEKKIAEIGIPHGTLARKLGVSEGAVSHILNNPENLTLKTIVAYARVLGLKVSVVAYDDGDRNNERGPIDSELFAACWENAGKPSDFWSLRDKLQLATTDSVLDPNLLVALSYTSRQLPWGMGIYSTATVGAAHGSFFRMEGVDLTEHIYPQSSTTGRTEDHA